MLVLIFFFQLSLFAQQDSISKKIYAYLYIQEMDSAFKYVKLGVEYYPQNEKINCLYADFLAKKKPRLAIDIYTQYQNNNENNFKLAKLYGLMSKFDSCAYYLNQYLNLTHNLSQSVFYSVPEFQNFQKTTYWRELMSKDYDLPYQKVVFDAQFFAKQSNFDKALSILDDYLSKSKQHQVFALRAKLLKNQKEYNSAFNDYQRAYNIFSDIDYLRGMAECLFLDEKYKKANVYFDRYLSKEKYDFNSMKLASFSAFNAKQYKTAKQYALEFLHYISNDTLNAIMGQVYIKEENYLSALKYLSLAIRQNPYNSVYYRNRALVYYRFENYKVADMDFTLYLDYTPKDAEVLYKRGMCRFYNNEMSRACKDWRSASNEFNIDAAKMYKKYCK
ncbi:MAG: hypothetical protein KAI79_16255 [Bacteroidales bacterium]|nr:hypothetical protein [Bacteroidales bacterium]